MLNRYSVAAFCVISVFSLSTLCAGPLDELTALQEHYEQTEDELLLKEMDYDSLLKARVEFDGIGGFFNKILFKRKKYKELKASMENAESGISAKWSEMKDAWEDIQKQTFEVGLAAEESGDYETAIKFYKQVQPRTDRERFRIGVCHKLDANYSEALTWFRKLNAGRDDVQFEIGATYALWEKHDKAVEAYCKVIASFGGSQLEEEALSLLEDYETQGSFSGLYQNIAAAYRQKAFASFKSDFDRAVTFYKKAMDYVARDYDNSAARASDALVRTASTDLTSALTILDEQNQAALEYYERKLQNAHSDFMYAKRSYQDALDDGAREFDQSLRRARQQKRTYERNYNRYIQQNLSEEADRAKRQMEHYENRIRYLLMNRDTIIYDSASYERRRMNDAEDTYHRILHSQQRIISDYVAPYRRAVNDARERLDQINAFHRAAYGF